MFGADKTVSLRVSDQTDGFSHELSVSTYAENSIPTNATKLSIDNQTVKRVSDSLYRRERPGENAKIGYC